LPGRKKKFKTKFGHKQLKRKKPQNKEKAKLKKLEVDIQKILQVLPK